MEKTIKIYINKIIYNFQRENYKYEDNIIWNDFFKNIVVFNKEKIDDYISIIKKIGSINEDMNDINKFNSLFDIYLNYYVNCENENAFSTNIKSLFDKILGLMNFNEKEKKFYEIDFKDIVKNHNIINTEFSIYIIKLCSLFLKDNNFEKIIENNNTNELLIFINNYINCLLGEKANLVNLKELGNELIKDKTNSNNFFLNIIWKIENSNISDFIEEFTKNSQNFESETINYEQKINEYKNKIEEIFMSDEIEPEQFESKFDNYRYFIYLDYPSLEGIKKCINDEYILINFYINNYNKNELDTLDIININNFETKLLDYYNNMNFITKNYSKQKINSILPQEFLKDFDEYKTVWNKLYGNFEINENMNLECVLNTNDKENTFGNQISSFYKNLIETHNKYISDFIDYIKRNKLTKYWENFLSERKLIQNIFSEYNFFSFKEKNINANKYNNLYEILFNNSNRDIIYKENKFYYKNCKIIKYNLSKIEQLFQIYFLIGKSYFKDKQIFIEYNKFDPLNKNIFFDYNNQFKQENLEESKKKSIYQLLNKGDNKDENKKREVLSYIKKLMILNKSNNIFNKENNIIKKEIIMRHFEIPQLFAELLSLEIKNECIINLYEFIELSIIYNKYYNIKPTVNYKDIILRNSTVSILRKFYYRFIDTNEISKDLPIGEVIFNNRDLLFKIPYEKKTTDEIRNVLKEDIKKYLNEFKVDDCLKLYLSLKSQDKELQKYSDIEKNNKKKARGRQSN